MGSALEPGPPEVSQKGINDHPRGSGELSRRLKFPKGTGAGIISSNSECYGEIYACRHYLNRIRPWR